MDEKLIPKDFEEVTLLYEGIKSIGEKAKEFWRQGVDVKIKSCQYDIVTQADPILEKDIKTLITEKFPDAKIVAEESGGEIGIDYWVIDPVDGTSAYAGGLPTWSIAIGHVQEGVFTFSLIYVPLGIDGPELYYAKKGKGAFMNGRNLRVSQKTELKDANIFIRSHEIRRDEDGILKKLITDSRMLWVPGSTSLGLSYLAAGKLDVVIAKNQAIWDCPGTLIVEEAGGRITIAEVSIPNPKRPQSKNILATNGLLHDIITKRLSHN